jgi:DNA repair exonuclease SbcCD nuclease subunit
VIGAVQRLPMAIDVESLVLPLTGRDGAVAAWCLAVPFLRPGDVPRAAGEDGADPYLAGIALLYKQAFELALSKRQDGQAIIAMGHCHMVDGQMSSDSERRIVIGGTEMLPAGIFDPAIAYAALGHLHLAQNVGKQEHIRYCGSPLPLSFAEVNYAHQVLRIDLDGAAVREIASAGAARGGSAAHSIQTGAAGAGAGRTGRAGAAGGAARAATLSGSARAAGAAGARPARAHRSSAGWQGRAPRQNRNLDRRPRLLHRQEVMTLDQLENSSRTIYSGSSTSSASAMKRRPIN